MRQFGSNPADAHLRKLMEDPRYWKDRDPAYVAMIQQGFKDLYDNPSTQARAAEGEAANEMGLNGPRHAQDSMVAHVTPGEVVIPLSAQTPELMRYLSEMLGSNLLKYTVGSGHEQQNPTSGLRAFADDDQSYCDDLWDKIEKQQAKVDDLDKKLKNDPGNIALAKELGSAELELRELQKGLGQCGFNY